LEEDTSEDNLLPFFHLLNNLIEELKITQERVLEMSEEFKKEIQIDIDILYSRKKENEKEFIEKAKKDISNYLKKDDIYELLDIISETEIILKNLERNKNLPESIIKKDIETLEKSLSELQEVI
jgi:Holliday junction resolvase RusA-like endonuclease